jgi:hypothetical protein
VHAATIITLLLLTVGCAAHRPFQSTDLESQFHAPFRNFDDGMFHFCIQNPQADEKAISRQSQVALRRSLSILGVDSYSATIHVFVFNSPEDIRKAIGLKMNSCAYPSRNSLLCLFSEALNTVASSHEITHVMSHNLWGRPSLLWVSEGLAVLSDDRWQGLRLRRGRSAPTAGPSRRPRDLLRSASGFYDSASPPRF